MFATALIVFRETLEAALFVGIVAAATRQLAGRGQDVVNIGVLSLALMMLLWHCTWVAAHSREMAGEARRIGASVQQGGRRPWALTIAIALAVLREGAETVLFVGGTLTGATDI